MEAQKVSYQEEFARIYKEHLTPREAVNAVTAWVKKMHDNGVGIDFTGLDEVRDRAYRYNRQSYAQKVEEYQSLEIGEENGYDSAKDSADDRMRDRDGAYANPNQAWNDDLDTQKVYEKEVYKAGLGKNYTAEQEKVYFAQIQQKVALEAPKNKLTENVQTIGENLEKLYKRQEILLRRKKELEKEIEENTKTIEEQSKLLEEQKKQLAKEEERLKAPEYQKIIARGNLAEQNIIHSRLYKVSEVAHKFEGRGIDFQDLEVIGGMELVKITRKHNPEKFANYNTSTFDRYVEQTLENTFKKEMWQANTSMQLDSDIKQRLMDYKKAEQELMEQNPDREPKLKEIIGKMNDMVNERAAVAFLGKNDDYGMVKIVADDIKAYKTLNNPIAEKEEFVEAKKHLEQSAEIRDMTPTEIMQTIGNSLDNIKIDGKTGQWRNRYGDVAEYEVEILQNILVADKSMDEKKKGNEHTGEDKVSFGETIAADGPTTEEIVEKKEENQENREKMAFIQGILKSKDFDDKDRRIVALAFGFEDDTVHGVEDITSKVYGHQSTYENKLDEINDVKLRMEKVMKTLRVKTVEYLQEKGEKKKTSDKAQKINLSKHEVAAPHDKKQGHSM